MYNYCTLFDFNYLTRGLAMYESLKRHSEKFHLYIFAFDDKSYNMLQGFNLNDTTVISLKEFENEDLLNIKSSRTPAEYCWTCTPSIIKYSIEKFNLESCTYLDADLYFFSNPGILIEEMGDKSVLITEHRYSKKYNYSVKNGIYCVQFMTFKNNIKGLEVLDWWKESCNRWCYARFEDGKFGDQKYLDDWVSRFDCIHVLENRGGGLAPWNIQQYNLNDKTFTPIFYHFHGLKRISNDKYSFSFYKFTKNDIELLYKPYVEHLEEIILRLKQIADYEYIDHIKKGQFHWKDPYRFFKKIVTFEPKNIYKIKKLK